MRAVISAALALAVSLTAVAARAEGGAWEDWPSGRTFTEEARPSLGPGEHRVCSFVQPVCVHAARSAPGRAVMSALATAEDAMTTFRDTSLLPAPMPDERGGSPAFDLYLDSAATADYRIHAELPTSFPVDRAAAFAVIAARLADGCARRTAIHRAVATSLLLAVDGGAAGGELASTAAYLAATSTGCTAPLLAAIDDAQREPWRSSFADGELDDPLASPLLPYYLDGGFGSGAPGSLLTALFYASRQSTPPDASRFHDSVDLATVLTKLAKGRQKQLDDILLDYATTRAFLGDRDDGQHLVELGFAGTFARPHFDASWTVASLPRRVAFTPLEPMGAVFVWLDLAGASKGLTIGFHAEWESPVTMRWALVRVGTDGREVSRIEVTREKGVRTVERRILELDDLAGLLVVGVSAGEVGQDHPYRVDETPAEPHGGTVYLVRDEP